MTTSDRFLDGIDVASPCTASWDAMTGDDQSRFCGQCELRVYNLSGMTAAAATELVWQREGRLCVRLHRRTDGTVLTQDCPVGHAALRDRLRRRAHLAYARVAAFCGLLLTGLGGCRDRAADTSPAPPETLARPDGTEMGLVAPGSPDCRVEMGEVAAPVIMGKIKAPAAAPQPVDPPTTERPEK